MAECTSSSSSWSNVSSANQRYRDLDTAAMHFWIDKRGAEGSHGGPGGHGSRYRHRVSASLSSARLPPGAAPQRRRRPSRSSRAAAPKQALVPVHRGTAGGDASSSGTAALGLAGAPSTAGSSSRRGPGQSPAASAAPAPGPLLSRAARAHLALPRPRPHLAYIGSTGSGIRAHAGHGVAGAGLGGVLVDLPLEAGHGHPNSVLGASSSGSDRGDVFGLGALPLPAHGETGPVLMDRFTCGLWASFALASVFVAGTKFYLDFQSSGMEAMVLSLLLMIFLMVGCTASICRARVNSQLAAAAAAATASALREPGPGLAASQLQAALQLQQPGELTVLIGGADGAGQQEQLLQQVQQEQLAEQQQSGEPPPPYHIAMLDEQPPPAYEKVVT